MKLKKRSKLYFLIFILASIIAIIISNKYKINIIAILKIELLLILLFFSLKSFWWLCNNRAKNIIVFMSVIVISLIIPVLINESYKNNAGYKTLWGANELLMFYGTYLTFIGTFGLSYTIYISNNKRYIEQAKNSGKALCSILDTVNKQLRKLDGKQDTIIKYDQEWKNYFFMFSELDLKYSDDFLKQLDMKFESIDLINEYIEKNMPEKAHLCYKTYIENQNCSLANFNITEVEVEIRINSFKTNYKSFLVPWKEVSGCIDTIRVYSEKYYYVIENWIYAYLLKVGIKSIESYMIEHEIIEWLLTNDDFKRICNFATDKRIIAQIIFEVSMKLNKKKSSRLEFTWGTYYLKK